MGDHIYGQDEETLEFVISKILNQHQLKLGLIEIGLDGKMTKRLQAAQLEVFVSPPMNNLARSFSELEAKIKENQQESDCDIWFGIAVNPKEKNLVHFFYQNSDHKEFITRKYGGPKEYIPLWAQVFSPILQLLSHLQG